MAKYYMVYLPEATGQAEQHEKFLMGEFGENRVYPLKGGGAFAVKTDEDVHFKKIMDRIGFNEDAEKSGVAIEFDATTINGWYSKSFWQFLKD